MNRILVMVAAIAFSAAASAQLYKWVDGNGKVQYGDTPPGDAAKVTRLRAASPGAAPEPVPAADAKKDGKDAKDKEKALTPEQAFQKRQQERQQAEAKAEKEREQTEQRRANCETAQTNLRQLQSGQRMWTVNAAGERVFIDDEQRTRELQRAQKSAAEWCK